MNVTRRDLMVLSLGVALGVGAMLASTTPTASADSGGGKWVSHASQAEMFQLAKGKAKASLILNETTGASKASLGLFEAKPGFQVPEHIHEESAELLYVLEGNGLMTIAGAKHKVKPGTAIYVPPMVKHSFVVEGQTDFNAVQVYAGPGPEQRFRKIGEPVGK